MREILFRGKRLDNDEWIEGFYYINSALRPIMAVLPDEIGRGRWYEVDPATVGQYTGLKDCKGKPVFEGDIVRLSEYVKRTFDVSDGVVNWSRGAFFVGDCDRIIKSLSVVASAEWVLRGEVIGNIHDNPELLDKEAGK